MHHAATTHCDLPIHRQSGAHTYPTGLLAISSDKHLSVKFSTKLV
jgi:hypothetical protein